jgi:hypothetical protein
MTVKRRERNRLAALEREAAKAVDLQKCRPSVIVLDCPWETWGDPKAIDELVSRFGTRGASLVVPKTPETPEEIKDWERTVARYHSDVFSSRVLVGGAQKQPDAA